MSTSSSTQSRDGTIISFSRAGSGPALVLVEPAGHFRELSAFGALVPLLTSAFTVYTYDRRGRGQSSDTLPYAPEREVEDLEALIEEAGGHAFLYGYSSGALLALHAAAKGASIDRLALLEPPLQEDSATRPDPLTGQLADLIAAGRSGDAVEHFHSAIGVPPEIIEGMRGTDRWSRMTGIAHTLVYDCQLSDATTTGTCQAVGISTLVLDSEGSSDDLSGWAARVASLIPLARYKSLPGEWHGVAPELIAAELREFFGA
jgi:pimeloyl-ACP methyl ester carboxylesterase